MSSHLYNGFSLHERKDLEKYVRFFLSKAAQVIVQSRLGNRATHKCKVISSGTDWFYVAVKDVKEISDATKQCLANVHTLSTFTFNVEIFLTTKDGQKMVLETWSGHMNEHLKENVKINYTVYQRLSRLLRSLICVTRNERGYHLARTQSADSFVICYRMYHGKPDLSQIGGSAGEPKRVDIGSVATPVGTVKLEAYCRSQLLFSPTNSYGDLDLKENYFTTESPTSTSRLAPPLGNSSNRLLNSPDYTDGYGTDGGLSCGSTPPTDYEIIHHSFNGSRKTGTKSEQNGYKELGKEKTFRIGTSSSDNTDSSGSAQLNRTPEKVRRTKGFAFAPRRASQISLDEEVPFSLLVEQAERNGGSDTLFPPHSPETSMVGKAFSTSLFDDPEFMEQYKKPSDDFILVDVKTPFAAAESEDDIGRFYKKFHRKQDLMLLHTGETISDTLQQLDLDVFEQKMEEFDDFCNQLNIPTDHKGSPV